MCYDSIEIRGLEWLTCLKLMSVKRTSQLNLVSHWPLRILQDITDSMDRQTTFDIEADLRYQLLHKTSILVIALMSLVLDTTVVTFGRTTNRISDQIVRNRLAEKDYRLDIHERNINGHFSTCVRLRIGGALTFSVMNLAFVYDVGMDTVYANINHTLRSKPLCSLHVRYDTVLLWGCWMCLWLHNFIIQNILLVHCTTGFKARYAMMY